MKFVVFIQRIIVDALIFVQSDSGIGFDEVEVDLVAEKFSDVVHTISVKCQHTKA